MGRGQFYSRLLRLERGFAAPSRIAAKASPAAVPASPIDVWARQHLPGYFSRPFSLFHHWLVGQLRDLHQRLP